MKTPKILSNIEILSLGYGGVGIAKAPDGRTILIKGGLPGSVVDAKVVKQKKEYIEAHITQVHSVPENLLTGELKCPHYLYDYLPQQSSLPKHKTGCGGCKRQVIDYSQQLALKRSIVEDCCSKLLLSQPQIDIKPVLGSPKIFGYRNKIEFSFGKYIQQAKEHKDGNVSESIQEHRLAGFHRQGAFEKVVDVDQCYLISDTMHQVYAYLKALLQKSGLPVYDIKQHTGFLRHLVIREGVHTGQLLVNLVIAPKYFQVLPPHEQLRESIKASLVQDSFLKERVSSFCLTVNNGLADVVKASDYSIETLRGEGQYFEQLHLDYQGNTSISQWRVSPFSFFQTNSYGAELLFSSAMQMIGKISGNIIDLYCGSGTIGLSFLKAGLGKSVKGIEIVADAVQDAYFNAKINGLEGQAEFYAGKAEDIIKQDTIQNNFFIGDDLVIVDPPREGLHPSVIDFINNLRKQQAFKLLYISCNPLTFARDLLLLSEGRERKFDSIQPVDMFPHTHHIECITVAS